jgi:hypothetical protein
LRNKVFFGGRTQGKVAKQVNSIRTKYQKSYFSAEIAATLCVLFVSLVLGCQPRNQLTDEAQAQVERGNANLKKMAELESELATIEDIKIQKIYDCRLKILLKDRAGLIELKTRLESYIRSGHEIQAIASRTDLVNYDVRDIDVRVKNAKLLLNDVATRLDAKQPGVFGAQFWEEYEKCIPTLENTEIYGVNVAYYLSGLHDKAIEKLTPAQCEEILVRLDRYIHCRAIAANRNSAVWMARTDVQSFDAAKVLDEEAETKYSKSNETYSNETLPLRSKILARLKTSSN